MIPHAEEMLDAVAALAVGALPGDEAQATRAHLLTCESCRAEYRELASAASVVAGAGEAEAGAFPAERAEALKMRVLAAVVAQRPEVPHARSGYARVVPYDELIAFAPGISWAVVPTGAMTLVYWVFEPPECGKLPPEFHPQTQAGVVLEGTMVLHYGDGTRQSVRAGDVYAIEAGTTHGASFEERTVLFDVYSPNHAEFEALYRAMRER